MALTNITEELLPDLLSRFKEERIKAASEPIWQEFNQKGSAIWLDTGDMEAIDGLIATEVSAMTTNNTLLNREVQKGIYDGVIREVAPHLKKLNPQERVVEMAFLLNALHGSRLVNRYGGMVSVELHTDLAHDVEGIVNYGRRFHRINPDHFLVKVPFSAAGLIGARRLSDEGIPVNFTLLFSLRQNVLAALVARPAFTNVFLGRIGAYMADNGLAHAEGPGEKVVHATQNCMRHLNQEYSSETRLIAASIRGHNQVPLLCGIDVLTIPAAVAADSLTHLRDPLRVMNDHDFNVIYNEGVVTSYLKMHKLWSIGEPEKKSLQEVARNVPAHPAELINFFHQHGMGDIFPNLSEAEQKHIRNDGKIPKHKRWAGAIRRGETAIDTLLSLAGLAAFAKDQDALDDRIRRVSSGL